MRARALLALIGAAFLALDTSGVSATAGGWPDAWPSGGGSGVGPEINSDYLILDTDDVALPLNFTDPPGAWIHKPTENAAALILDKGPGNGGQLMCLGQLDSTGGVDQDFSTGLDDECNTIFGNNGSMQTGAFIIIAGDQYFYVDDVNGRILGARGAQSAPTSMLIVYPDVIGPGIVVAPGQGNNSSLAYWMSRNSAATLPAVTAVFDDDDEGNENAEGFSMWLCDPDDLGNNGTILFDTDTTANTITAQSGTPFSGLVAGDRVALRPHDSASYPSVSMQALLEVTTVNSATQITVGDVPNQGTRTGQKVGIYRCDQRIYRNFTTGDVSVEGTFAVPDTLKIPRGADCPATCEVGSVWMDTNTAADTNCTSSYSGAVCGCHTANTWGCP